MKKGNFFWVGYSDLLTSLFFVMLVLFVVTIAYLKYRIETTEEELDKIRELQTAIQQLPEEYFEYQPQYKRFKLNQHVQFGRGKSEIESVYHEYLLKVGQSIRSLIENLNQKEELRDLDIKYLVVIEGMASMDKYALNYELSYERALSLFRFWESRNIIFDPKSCEVQISGSGIGGIREYSGDDEFRNQQFLIHIIPKMGTINKPELSFGIVEEKGREENQIEETKEAINLKERAAINWKERYDSIGAFFQDDIAVVRKNLKFGFVNKEGKEIIPPSYDYVGPSGTYGFYTIVKDQKIGIINASGKIIAPLKYDGIGEWSEGLAMVFSNDKCGYINSKGVEVIPLSYNKCNKFTSGRAKVLSNGREFYIDAENNLAGMVVQ